MIERIDKLLVSGVITDTERKQLTALREALTRGLRPGIRQMDVFYEIESREISNGNV